MAKKKAKKPKHKRTVRVHTGASGSNNTEVYRIWDSNRVFGRRRPKRPKNRVYKGRKVGILRVDIVERGGARYMS